MFELWISGIQVHCGCGNPGPHRQLLLPASYALTAALLEPTQRPKPHTGFWLCNTYQWGFKYEVFITKCGRCLRLYSTFYGLFLQRRSPLQRRTFFHEALDLLHEPAPHQLLSNAGSYYPCFAIQRACVYQTRQVEPRHVVCSLRPKVV
jgi:hypothetical protein